VSPGDTVRAVLPACLLALILGCVLWIYYPGINGPALLDDYSSLGDLGDLTETPEQALDRVGGDKSGPLGRRVSMATFVAGEFLGGGIAGAKLVNIALHLVTGALVAWFFTLLLAPLRVPGYRVAAILGAGLWLLAPLQVSTVLYLVQRMAQLAALFGLLSLICYLYWRRGLGSKAPRHGWLILSVCTGALAVFSKENALVCLPILLLMEAFWLQFRDATGRELAWLRRTTLALIAVGAVAVCVLLMFYWDSFGARYQSREYTVVERLLTQSRLLWDYLAQFYLPDVARLGIYHDDVPLSTSVWQPANTLSAILGWLAVLGAAVLLWRWPAGRRLAFGPLFFLAGHSLESTVWPLELYFEHRNYLPSVGLALLPLTVYALLAGTWREVARPLQAWMACLLLYPALLTSSQVQIWSSAPLLAFQQANGHPDSARANAELATRLAQVGGRDAALRYSARAYQSRQAFAAAGDEHHGDYILRNVALACIAGQPLTADEYSALGRDEPQRPLGSVVTMTTLVQLYHDGVCPDFDWNGFLDHLQGLYLQRFDTHQASVNMYLALGTLANAAQRWEDAYGYTARALAEPPQSNQALLMMLHFTTALGREDEARKLIAQLQALQIAGKLNRRERDNLALYLEK